MLGMRQGSMARFCLFIVFWIHFGTIHSKHTSLEGLETMKGLQEEHGDIIPLDYEIFKKYVKSKHSKYSVIVMFTALNPKYNCEVCEEAKDEFVIVASSYQRLQSESNIFFAFVDFESNQNAFVDMGLSHAPEFLYFPSGRNRKKKSDKLDTMRAGYDADALAKWLYSVSGEMIPIRRPVDYTKYIAGGVAACIGLILLILKPNLCLQIASNTTLWGTSILLLVFSMTSGQMWNFIRKPMDIGHNYHGEPELVLTGDHAQFRYESYIVIALNAVISFGFILLNQAKEIDHKYLKKVVGLIGLCLVVIFFGLLVSLFRMKTEGYPYLLLFK